MFGAEASSNLISKYFLSSLSSPPHPPHPPRLLLQSIIDKIPAEDSKCTYVYDRYLFHYIRQDGIVYLCMGDEAFGRRIPFAFLIAIQKDFESFVSAKLHHTLPAKCASGLAAWWLKFAWCPPAVIYVGCVLLSAVRFCVCFSADLAVIAPRCFQRPTRNGTHVSHGDGACVTDLSTCRLPGHRMRLHIQ